MTEMTPGQQQYEHEREMHQRDLQIRQMTPEQRAAWADQRIAELETRAGIRKPSTAEQTAEPAGDLMTQDEIRRQLWEANSEWQTLRAQRAELDRKQAAIMNRITDLQKAMSLPDPSF